jgi:pimeloyl-ACP methyl ester carboxylesterase
MAILTRDGVQLYYEEAGIGGPPIVLVHGFLGHRSHLAPQFTHFSRAHRTVVVDRRGYGDSDAPEQDYTIANSADDLAWLCSGLGLYKPVLVQHSMDKIAFDLAARYPDLLGGVVLLDTPTFAPPPVWAGFKEVARGLRTPNYRQVVHDAATSIVFAPTDDPRRKSQLLEAMMSLPQHVIASELQNFIDYDVAPAVAACKLPMLRIGSWFPSDTARLRELCPQLVTGQVVGAGHFAQLEVPDQVNAMIDRFLALTCPR